MATNAVYQKLGSTLTFKASGGSAVFTPKTVANGAGRQSAALDFGAFPRANRWTLFAQTQCDATPTIGNLIRQYLVPYATDSGPADGAAGLSTSDAAFATEANLRNLIPLKPIVVRAAAANTIFTCNAYGIIIPTRYCAIVWWNASGAALTNDDAEHEVRFTPEFDDIQAAA